MFGPGSHPHPSADGYNLPPEQQAAQYGGFGTQPINPNKDGMYNNAAYGAPPTNSHPGAYPGPLPNTAGKTTVNQLTSFNLIWFSAACCVMLGAFISFLSEFFTGQWADALEMLYFLVFGILMATLDTPILSQHEQIQNLRISIAKYIAVLQRVTGKGIAYIFLGSALTSSMWANLEGGFMIFLTVLIGFFIVAVGFFSLVVAVVKSRNLNLVRVELQQDGSQSLPQLYERYAKLSPHNGLTQEEFKALTPQARGVSFEAADIKLIFNALSSYPKRDFISREDLQNWVHGDMMVFI